MIKKFDSKNMGSSNHGWLTSKFHFSFADYFNRYNMNFGVLRVINDDIVQAQTGFDTHPHKDMEIISYVVSGELTHKDSMGNEKTISRGDFQYMSAGTGVEHSEYNNNPTTPVRLLQIWILPDKKGHSPNYGDFTYDASQRKNTFFHAVSKKGSNSPIEINQDVNIFVSEISKGESLNFNLKENRQLYLVQIEGISNINSHIMNEQDALTSDKENLNITAIEDTHLLIIEMAKSN